MSKTVCLYPEDATTTFLLPLYEHICNVLNAVGIHNDTTDEDDALDKIYKEIEDADLILFLGHGNSANLYGSRLDNVVFEESNHQLLKDKTLFLLACNSADFIHRFGYTNAIGFDFLPTSLDDVRTQRMLHNIRIEELERADVNVYKDSLVHIFINTISKETMTDFHLFKERLKFNVSQGIVDCLINKKSTNYRVVADELYYLYKDMDIR